MPALPIPSIGTCSPLESFTVGPDQLCAEDMFSWKVCIDMIWLREKEKNKGRKKPKSTETAKQVFLLWKFVAPSSHHWW